jgi:2'-5' RNA ligase
LSAERIRAFVALRMAPRVDDAIIAFVDRLKPLSSDVSWVDSANLHLTLKFLGAAVPLDALEPLVSSLERLARSIVPFEVLTGGVGGFPNLRRPRVIWVGLESADLSALASRVEAVAIEAGFRAETRSYSPHLTIGRIRTLRNWNATRQVLETVLEADTNLVFGKSRIEKLNLYRSILSPKGATYDLLKTFPLGG